VEIEYILSDHQREYIEPLMERLRVVLPPWVASATVRFDPEITDVACVAVLPEYRRMNMQIGDSWFSEPPDEQRAHLIHEICHTYVEAMAAVFKNMLHAHTEEGSAMRLWGEEAMRIAEEGCVSDLSRTFAALLP
jgi:hypothetical protein